MQTSDNPALSLYSKALIELAMALAPSQKLDRYDVSARKHSKLCGSEIGLKLQFENGLVSAFEMDVAADALGRASSAAMQEGLIGADISSLRALIASARDVVLRAVPPESEVSLRWPSLHLLSAIKPFPQRHPSTLLVFDVLEECLDAHERTGEGNV